MLHKHKFPLNSDIQCDGKTIFVKLSCSVCGEIVQNIEKEIQLYTYEQKDGTKLTVKTKDFQDVSYYANENQLITTEKYDLSVVPKSRLLIIKIDGKIVGEHIDWISWNKSTHPYMSREKYERPKTN